MNKLIGMMIVGFIAAGMAGCGDEDVTCMTHDDCYNNEACMYEFGAESGTCLPNYENASCYEELPYCMFNSTQSCIWDYECPTNYICVGATSTEAGTCRTY